MTKPSIGQRSISPAAKSQAATEITAPNNIKVTDQNNRPKNEGLRAIILAAVCIARPSAAEATGSGNVGAVFTSFVDATAPSSSIKTGPLAITQPPYAIQIGYQAGFHHSLHRPCVQLRKIRSRYKTLAHPCSLEKTTATTFQRRL